HPSQVQHDVVVALADQVAQVLPELTGGLGIDVAAHGDNSVAVGGGDGGLQQWGHPVLLPDSSRPDPRSQPLLRTDRYLEALGAAATGWRWVARWWPGGL